MPASGPGPFADDPFSATACENTAVNTAQAEQPRAVGSHIVGYRTA